MTSDWTDAQTALIVAGTAAIAAAFAATAYPQVAFILFAILIGTIVVSLLGDVFAGLVTGLAGAAAATAIAQASSTPGEAGGLVPALVLAASIVVLGGAMGLSAERIRRGRRLAKATVAGAIVPAPSSMGLLGADDAAARMEEEQLRAATFNRPLSTAVVRVNMNEDATEAEFAKVERAVARTLETELRPTDIPFETDREGQLGVILVETDSTVAPDVLESVLVAAGNASYNDRANNVRKHVGEVATLSLAIKEFQVDSFDKAVHHTQPIEDLDTRQFSAVGLS